MSQLSEHFTSEELACKCCGNAPIKPILLELLEAIRNLVDTAIIINSGYRCPKHNKEVNGEPNSWHTQGIAADIRQTKYDNKIFHDMILLAYREGKLPMLGGLGLYDGRIHVDTYKAPDGHLRRWDYRKQK
jgi:uncharacterized protein YcbK (DUF882 family)